MALDVAKAYDSVDRDRLKLVLDHVGVTDNGFFSVLWQAMTDGETMVKGADERWVSSRGIKQGCPMSPLLFCILLSALQPTVESECPECGFDVAGKRIVTSYADDLKLITKTTSELNQVVASVTNFLAIIGLSVEVSKSKVLVVGDDSVTQVNVAGVDLEVQDSIRFLGVGINRTGKFFPWI